MSSVACNRYLSVLTCYGKDLGCGCSRCRKTPILRRKDLVGTWLYELPEEILNLIFRFGMDKQLQDIFSQGCFRPLCSNPKNHISYCDKLRVDYHFNYSDRYDIGCQHSANNDFCNRVYFCKDEEGGFDTDLTLFHYNENFIKLCQRYPWDSFMNFCDFIDRCKYIRALKVICMYFLKIQPDPELFHGLENQTHRDILYDNILNQVAMTNPNLNSPQTNIAEAFNEISKKDFWIHIIDDHYDTDVLSGERFIKTRSGDIVFSEVENEDYNINNPLWDPSKGYYLNTYRFIPKEINKNDYNEKIWKLLGQLKDSKRTFRKFLRVLRAKRIAREMNIYRWVHTDIQQHYQRDIYGWSQIHAHIKKTKANGRCGSVIGGQEYRVLPDRTRINQQKRFIRMIEETDNLEQKSFYLLKAGMLVYYHKHREYLKTARSVFGYNTGYPYNNYSHLGSIEEWEEYLVRKYANENDGYDLRQNMYKITMEIEDNEPIFDWEYKELTKYYRRQKHQEKVRIRKYNQYEKDYQYLLEQDKIISDIHLLL